VRRERSKNRSHVVEIKAFSCLPGASYPSLSDLAFQHRHTVLLLLLPPLPCLGLNKKTILAEHNNTMMPTTKCCPFSLSRQQVSVFKYTKAFGLSEALIIITITITIMSVNGLQKNFNVQNSRI